MGFNTSVIVMNDALHEISKDPNFGKNLASAVSRLSLPPEYRGGVGGVDVVAGNHCNAATAIESHHADYASVVVFGGNRAHILSEAVHPSIRNKDDSEDVKYLRALAEQMGYNLRKKPTPKSSDYHIIVN